MREILFRGKRLDGGAWAYGDYNSHAFDGNGIYINEEYILVPVDPETVGQYTGLTDKAGNKIFEGDVFIHPINPDEKKLVVWDEAGFVLLTDSQYGYEGKSVIVIGNIHDNPELKNEAKW